MESEFVLLNCFGGKDHKLYDLCTKLEFLLMVGWSVIGT